MESKFGKGLVVNLVKFSEHFNNTQVKRIHDVSFYLEQSDEKRGKMISDNPPPNCNYGKSVTDNIKYFLACEYKVHGSFKEGMSSMVTLWANGATDHLYEIKAPKGKEWNKIRKLVKVLQNDGLEMGHSFNGKEYTLKDILALWELVKKICLLIDEKLGLSPDWGEW